MPLSPKMAELLNAKKAKIDARNGGNAVKLKPGKNRIRIFPSKDPSNEQWWRDIGLHWIKERDDKAGKDKVIATIGCNEATFEQECETCAMIGQAILNVNEDDETFRLLTEAKKVNRRVIVNAAHKLGDAPDAVVITELPTSVFSDILNTIIQYADEFGDVLDLQNGLDFIIEKTGSGMDTDYSTMPAPAASAAPKMALADLPDLDAFITNETKMQINKPKVIAGLAKITGQPPMIGIGGPVNRGALTSGVKPQTRVIEGNARPLPAAVEEDVIDDTPRTPTKPTVIEVDEEAELAAAAAEKAKLRAAKLAKARADLEAAEAEAAAELEGIDAAPEVATKKSATPAVDADETDAVNQMLDELSLED